MRKLETASDGVVAWGCSNYPTKFHDIREPDKKHTTRNAYVSKKTLRPMQRSIRYGNMTKEVVHTPSKKIEKKTPRKPYEEIVAFLEIGREPLLKHKHY